jgi:hypothetical protein
MLTVAGLAVICLVVPFLYGLLVVATGRRLRRPGYNRLSFVRGGIGTMAYLTPLLLVALASFTVANAVLPRLVPGAATGWLGAVAFAIAVLAVLAVNLAVGAKLRHWRLQIFNPGKVV